MKKKIAKEDIDNVKSSLYYKIFDICIINNKKYFLDKEFNLIWDINKDVKGVINNNTNYFFDDVDLIINTVEQEIINNFSILKL
jgi:hypothetical protein